MRLSAAGARMRPFQATDLPQLHDLGAARRPLTWLGRAALYATMMLLLVLGVRDLLRPFSSPSGATAAAPAWAQAAEVYAARFARDYLTFDSSAPDRYKARIARYLPEGVDPMFGWDGQGRQAVTLTLPSGITVSGDRSAVVTIAVLVTGGTWEYLAVPVVAGDGAFVVAGTPALVPPPARASVSAPPELENDTALSAALMPTMAAFFAAYGTADATQLSYYAAPGARVSGVGGLTLAALVSLRVEAAGGGRGDRTAEADVRWSDGASGGSFVQSYALRLRQAEGRWYVASVGPGIGLGPGIAGATVAPGR